MIGIVKKQGQGFLGGGWQFDEAVVMPYRMMAGFYVAANSSPVIMVKGKGLKQVKTNFQPKFIKLGLEVCFDLLQSFRFTIITGLLLAAT